MSLCENAWHIKVTKGVATTVRRRAERNAERKLDALQRMTDAIEKSVEHAKESFKAYNEEKEYQQQKINKYEELQKHINSGLEEKNEEIRNKSEQISL